jgi:uncharacterized membrane protein (DUF441 family)
MHFAKLSDDQLFERLGLAIASLCGIAAFTILVAIITNKISAWDAWAAVFFAIVGGIAWLAGRAAKYILAGI